MNGRQAITVALAMCPDVVICDLVLPDVDGWAVARDLRQALGRSVTLVAFTALTSPDDARSSFEAGFDHHLRKPGSVDELVAIAARSVRERRELHSFQVHTIEDLASIDQPIATSLFAA